MRDVSKILLVDAEERAVLQLEAAFHQSGWNMIAAADAATTQLVLRREKPRAIVLSSSISGGAILVVRRLKSSVHTVGRPVIVIAKAGGPRKDEFTAAGANEYLEHWQDPSLVINAIKKHLGLVMPTEPILAPEETITNAERMAELKAADVLDTPPSKLLEEITRLAANLLQVPTALLSIVDRDRQFFKSQVGVPEPWASARQTPLSHSFCQWVVSSNEELVVDDARMEWALQSNLAIRDLGVIAYAGIPVTSKNGQVLGSFCAIDSKPRTWTTSELINLRDLAHMAEAAMLLDKMDRTETNPAIRMPILGSVIQHGARLLRRETAPFTAESRTLLLDIIENQAAAVSNG